MSLQLLLLLTYFSLFLEWVDSSCESPQYVTLDNGAGLIRCTFDLHAHNVYWYHDPSSKDPFIRYEEGAISGSGFVDGRYSIDQNGSLIIFDETPNSKVTYKVMSYNRRDHSFESQLVDVHTYGKIIHNMRYM